jgi:hypothetical protein
MLAFVGRLSLLIVLAVSAVVFSARPIALAQDASPEAGADAEMMQEGVTFMPIGFADGVALPSTASLIAIKATIEPGAKDVFGDDDPASGLLLVDSGALTIKIDAEVSVTRGDEEFGNFEMVAAGEETILEAGDVAYIPGSVAGEIRNDGNEQATGTIFLIIPGDLSEMNGDEATPAP